MYIVAVYDIKEKRVVKALKTCRKYFNWVQNSVFEGEISNANFEKFKSDMLKFINKEEDSLIIYTLRDERYSKREILGKEKNEITQFI